MEYGKIYEHGRRGRGRAKPYRGGGKRKWYPPRRPNPPADILPDYMRRRN